MNFPEVTFNLIRSWQWCHHQEPHSNISHHHWSNKKSVAWPKPKCFKGSKSERRKKVLSVLPDWQVSHNPFNHQTNKVSQKCLPLTKDPISNPDSVDQKGFFACLLKIISKLCNTILLDLLASWYRFQTLDCLCVHHDLCPTKRVDIDRLYYEYIPATDDTVYFASDIV